MEVDLLIARLARDQHSLVTRAQLLTHGLTERQIDYRVEVGLLVQVHPGVYRLVGVTPYFEQAVLAACLATGGVASHRAAAALFGLRGIKPGVVEITVSGRRPPRLEGVVSHHTRRLDRTEIGIIPVTTPMRTLVDLAAVEPRLVEGATNHALGRGLVKLPRLVRYVEEVGRSGRPGLSRMREVIELQVKGGGPTESWLEDRLVELLRRYGLPEPVRQYRLQGMRFDLAYPEVPLDVEADSRLWHSTPADRRWDAARDAAARLAGWAVERVTWLQVEEEPDAVAARIGRWLRAGEKAA